MRKKTKEISIGGLKIGAGNPIAVQSMTNTDTRNISATVNQIEQLINVGCEIVRVAVVDMEAAAAIKSIKASVAIPLVADIHFDYRLALAAIENGADKLRINPGNIGGADKVRAVAEKAKDYGVPIRVGVNSGSLEKRILEKHGGVTAEGLVESTLENVALLESFGFDDIVIAIKASSVVQTIDACILASEKTDYPLHIGVTESGLEYSGLIKSAVGIGSVLSRGIGDTIRVSLTGDPVAEVKCAREILKALMLRKFGAEFISCPTCGRTRIDMIPLAREIEAYCNSLNKDIKIAVMGCAVNGPGEAKDADIGIAGGEGEAVLFKHGKIVRKINENKILEELKKEIDTL